MFGSKPWRSPHVCLKDSDLCLLDVCMSCERVSSDGVCSFDAFGELRMKNGVNNGVEYGCVEAELDISCLPKSIQSNRNLKKSLC